MAVQFLKDYNAGRVYWSASEALLRQRAPLSKQNATITWLLLSPLHYIFQNQGKTADLTVLPPMASLSINQKILD